jgi:hypothetical protein
VVDEAGELGGEARLVPAGVTGGAEEHGALVVVDAVDGVAEFACEVDADFGADEAGGAGDEEGFGHAERGNHDIVFAETEAPDEGFEGGALHEEGHGDHSKGQEDDDVAAGERSAIGQHQRNRKGRGQGDGAAHAGPTNHQSGGTTGRRGADTGGEAGKVHAGVDPDKTREHGGAGDGDRQADELGGAVVAADSGEERGELQAEEDEGDAVEPVEQNAPDGEGGLAGFDVHVHGIAPARVEAGGDDGEHTGNAAGFGGEVGGKRCEEGERDLDVGFGRGEALQQIAEAADAVADGETDGEADDGDEGERGGGAAEGETAAGDDGGEGELERDEAGGVVHETLAVENRGEAGGDAEALGDGVDGDGVGGRDDGAEGEGHGERQARHEPVGDEADGERGENHEADGEGEDGAAGAGEFAERHKPAVGEEQGRQKAEKEEAGIEREAWEGRHERGADTAEQVSDELRPREPAADDAQAGDQQEQDESVFEGDHEGSGRPGREVRVLFALAGVDDEGDGAVVDEGDGHHGAELAGGDGAAERG